MHDVMWMSTTTSVLVTSQENNFMMPRELTRQDTELADTKVFIQIDAVRIN
jgi:hypothetical protein